MNYEASTLDLLNGATYLLIINIFLQEDEVQLVT